MTSKPKGINRSIGGKSLLHFGENVASARHFQPPSEEDDEVLLSDCAMFCSARLWCAPLARFACKARCYFPCLFEP